MDNVTQNSVIKQLISLLPFHVDSRCMFDHYAKKLTIAKSIVLFTITLLGNWSSYRDMEIKVRANENLKKALQLPKISGSQLSRKLNEIPTEILQELFLSLAVEMNRHTAKEIGISKEIGKLGIVDSTSIHVPYSIGNWARLSNKDSSVKMHLRVIAASPEIIYPDHMIPTTRNYDDREIAVDMITDADVTYVMDRGYVKYKTMDKWAAENIRFVMRIHKKLITTVIEDRAVAEGTRIRRDAIVRLGGAGTFMKESLRLIEFVDEKGRFYRVVTTRLDLTPEEIAEIYRSRWMIELFFKWMKQHLRFVKPCSYKPQGLWNQLFMALIGSLLMLKLKLMNNFTKTIWEILLTLTTYLAMSWKKFMAEMNRKPTKASKGRQKKPESQSSKVSLESGVGLIKPQKENPKKRKSRKKQ
jgi:hypothetical protein